MKNKKKHKFFLNPYEDCAFTRCPKCDAKTKVRKFLLVISIEPKQLLVLNKQCKYCVGCDLIIVKKKDIESLMLECFPQLNPDSIENQYLVMGTVDRKYWQKVKKQPLQPPDFVDKIDIFKDIWNFEVIPAGWYPNE